MKGIIVGPGGGQISSYLAAVGEGLNRHGIEVEIRGDAHRAPGPPAGDFAVCWGWRKGAQLRARGYDVLVVERGYIGDRREWTSLAWNGLNGRGDFCLEDGVRRPDAARRALLKEMVKPWRPAARRKSDIILLMGQVPQDQSLQGKDLEPWYRDMARQARLAHGLPVLFRPHPVAVQKRRHRFNGLAESGGTLSQDLARAWGVVTFNSNSAVDAVLAGVPAMTVDPGAMAWAVTAHEMNMLGQRPPRAAWAARVSWCQWQLGELCAGVWWDRMQAGLGRNTQTRLGGRDGTDSRRAAAR